MTKKPFSGNLTNHKIGTRAAPARGRASSILVAALVIFSTLAIPPLALAAPDDVHTYAGGGICATTGPALDTCIESPDGLAVDSLKNIYVAESATSRILKIDTDGNISRIAGNGTNGFCGDGGPAIAACLSSPSGLALDSSGNLYVADTGNSRIRRVNTSGTISTVAGTGSASFCGDGGAATSACLNGPLGLTLDSAGNLFIADTGNNRVRKIESGNISTVAGSATQGFCGDGGPATSACLFSPSAVAFNLSGVLFIADTQNNRVRRVTPVGSIFTFAGNGSQSFCGDNGPAASACLNQPTGLSITGNVYIADFGNHRVRRVESSGNIITIGGTGQEVYCGDGLAASICVSPRGLALDVDLAIYISDLANYRVYKMESVDTSGGQNSFQRDIQTIGGNGYPSFCGDGGTRTNACFRDPVSTTYDSSGNLYIADPGNHRIRKITPSGTVSTVAGGGDRYEVVPHPDPLLLGQSLWRSRTFCGDGGPATDACLNFPQDVEVSGTFLYIADTGNHRVRRVNLSTGIITTYAGNGTAGTCVSGSATGACLSRPVRLALDTSGNLFISNLSASVSRIARVSTTGTISVAAGKGTPGFDQSQQYACPGDGGPATFACLNSPGDLIFDSAGNLLFVDGNNNRIRKISGGVISTIAGNGSSTFCGESVPGPTACMKTSNQIGPSLHSLAPEATNGTASVIDNGSLIPRSNIPGSVQAVLRVSGNSRTANSTVKIEHSSNNVNWFDLVTFAPVGTGTLIPQLQRWEINRPIQRFVRASWTLGGTAGSLTFSIHIERTSPSGLTLDSNDHLFFSDTFNQRIRRVSDSGVINTIAGSGTGGLCGDGGPSSSACFLNPMGVSFDSLGNLYAADSSNHRIRQIENFSGWANPVLTVSRSGAGTGTVTSSPAGINCGSACWKAYTTGTIVTLSATPDSGYYFVGWSGACTGTASCVVTMDSSKAVNAIFGIPTLTVTRSGSGAGNVTSSPAGITCGTQCSSQFPAGTTITLVATPDNSVFAGWSGACSGTGNCVITLNSPTSVDASFSTHPLLTVTKSGTGVGTITSNPSGINCPTQCGAYYPNGTEVELSATPGPNSTFEGWSGACSGTGSCVVTVDQSKTVGASFKAYPVLTVTKYLSAATASGSVTSDPAGIDCGTQCSASYASGTVVTLTAVAGSNSFFAGWFGACSGTGSCVVTMSESKSVTAAFNPNPTLTILNRSAGSLAGGTGQGTVTSDPTGISCGAQCSSQYAPGTVVTLTATASPGSVFTGWSGGGCSGTGLCVVTVTESRTVTATFHLTPFVTLCALLQIPFVC